MKIKNKKAELNMKETLELILGVAAVLLLGILIYKLFFSGFDKNDETAKSYLATFKNEIEKADGKNTGEFEIISYKGNDFYAVYFGEKLLFKQGDINFISKTLQKNKLCICYKKSDSFACDNCISLNYPAEFEGLDLWVIEKGTKVKIGLDKNKYLLQKV